MRLNQVTLACLDYEASCSFHESPGLIRIITAAFRPGGLMDELAD